MWEQALGHNVVVCDSDSILLGQVTHGLEAEGHEVFSCMSGKDCQLYIYKNKVDILIIDFNVVRHSALEVMKYVRLNFSRVKVILTIPSQEEFQSLGVTDEILARLGVCNVISKPYQIGQLLAAIEGISRSESWRDVVATDREYDGKEESVSDSKFTRVSIGDFYSGNAAIFDCYIRLGMDKYIKVLHKGDFFDDRRVERFRKNRDVEYLYFKTSDRSIYINFVNSLLSKLVKSDSVPIKGKVRTAQNLVEKYLEEIHTAGLKPEMVDEGKKICESIYEIVRSDQDLALLLSEYEDYDPPAYAHLFLVAFMSTVICKNLEWASKRTVELITFGSFVHDIGFLQLPPTIRETQVDKMSPDQFAKFKEHPYLGMKMLEKFSVIKEPILQIVYQHHEYVNGEGFPNGLPGIRIYPLAKVVALADSFSTYIAENKITPLKGLRQLIPDKEFTQKFDPILIKALVKGFIRK